MSQRIIKSAFSFMIVLVCVSALSGVSACAKKKELKNIILVLDTSMSMIGESGTGYKGKDILAEVKTSIENYIDKVSDGDKITFMTFDTVVKMFPAVLVETKNDRDILKKFISATEAKGKWTYTINMLKTVFKKAEELAQAEKDRRTVIVIMTDALDDPPPGKRGEMFSIKSLTSEYSGKDWWIYFISFSDLQKNEKVAAELRKDLKKVAEKSQVIEAGGSPEKGIGEVEKSTVPQDKFPGWVIVAIAAVVLLVIVLILLKKKGGAKVAGRLEYWNTDILDPYIEKFDMTRHNASEIVVGKNVTCQLFIRDIEIPGTFSIVAMKKPAGLAVRGSQGVEITFRNGESTGMLADGDIFQAGNYAFKYYAA